MAPLLRASLFLTALATLLAGSGTGRPGDQDAPGKPEAGAQDGPATIGSEAGAQDGPAAGEKAAGLEWRSDLAAARKEARDGGRPLLLYLRCVP